MHLTGIDHIVLNVRDVERSLRFYTEVPGLTPERVESWRAGKNGFPSVRLNETAILGLAGGQGWSGATKWLAQCQPLLTLYG